MTSFDDIKIFKNKYYVWVYRWDEPKVIRVGFYTRREAKFTIENEFGKDIYEYIGGVIKGSVALKNGWDICPNNIKYKGKNRRLRRFFIPPDANSTIIDRKQFRRVIKRRKGSSRSARIEFERKYLEKAYGRRKREL